MNKNHVLNVALALALIVALMLSSCGPGGDDVNGGNSKANGDGKVLICHKTDNASKPYKEMSVSENALKGHGKHVGDIIPAPEGGCPK
jgi:hypothetical protein